MVYCLLSFVFCLWSLVFWVGSDAENAGRPYRKGNLLDVLGHSVGVDVDPAPLGGRLTGWGRGLLERGLQLNGDRFHGGTPSRGWMRFNFYRFYCRLMR
jgi:hypothetical protein